MTVTGRTRCPKCAAVGRDTKGNNLVAYDDGHAHCFSCKYTTGVKGRTRVDKRRQEPIFLPENAVIAGGIPDRDIKASTCVSARVYERALINKKTREPMQDKKGFVVEEGIILFTFYDQYKKLVGIKYRDFYAEYVEGRSKDTCIWVEGSINLGGLHTAAGKAEACIWEGEIDWLTAIQVDKTRDHYFIPGNKATKYIKEHTSLLRKYRRVYIGFDNDAAGDEARDEVKLILPMHKLAFIDYGVYNDLNEAYMDDPASYKALISMAYQEPVESLITGGELIENFEGSIEKLRLFNFVSCGLPSLNRMLGGGLLLGELALLVADTGIGKALDIRTPVWTLTGWKSHGDLVPGDYVYHPSGTPVKVVGTTGHFHDRPSVRMSFNKGEDIVCDENHLWTVTYLDKNYERHTTTLTAGELASTNGKYKVKGSHRGYRLPKVEPVLEADSTVPIPPYILGYFYLKDVTRTLRPSVTNCIQVDSPDGLYCAGLSMVPTHNSTLCATIVADMIEKGHRVLWIGTEMQYTGNTRKLVELLCGDRMYTDPDTGEWNIPKERRAAALNVIADTVVFYRHTDYDWEVIEEAIHAAIYTQDINIVVVDVLTDLLTGEWSVNEQIMMGLSQLAAGDEVDARPPLIVIGVCHTKDTGTASQRVTVRSIAGGKSVRQKATFIAAMEGAVDDVTNLRTLRVLKRSRMNDGDTAEAYIKFNSVTRRYEDAEKPDRETSVPATDNPRVQVRARQGNRRDGLPAGLPRRAR